MNLVPMALLTLSLTGCVSRQGGVSLSIVSATAKREEDVLSVSCYAALDNRTGAPLSVSSYFFSAFDGLSLAVYDDHDGFLYQQSFLSHQSPWGPARPFTLYPGRTRERMCCPMAPLANAPNTLRLRLVGRLPGSAYTGSVTSQVYRVTVKAGRR